MSRFPVLCWRFALSISVSLLSGASIAGTPPSAGEKQQQVELGQQQQEELLAERDQFWDEAWKYDEQGKQEPPLKAGMRMLEIERRLFGKVHEEVLFSLNWLADRYEEREEFAQAEPLRKEALSQAPTG